ncbi:hypothetical protein AAFF_G00360510 [Aldrovandia affinis]|uniref:Uncharacterized protein n=1 Tax=Aldrovandia affinis TaxID=143900 RepID=A0AAD7SIU4_9TELE|nr:hypothetical protein AAFF_G00360510 [Aldrovandia affinis]
MALNVELQQRQTEQEKLLAQRDDVSSQLQEVNRANSRLLEQVTELGQEKDKLQQELEATRKTADKRKAMLDELAIDVAQEKSRHKEELSDVWLQHENEGTRRWVGPRLIRAITSPEPVCGERAPAALGTRAVVSHWVPRQGTWNRGPARTLSLQSGPTEGSRGRGGHFLATRSP